METKKQYYKLAKQFHSDVNRTGDENRLKDIIDAYKTLTSPAKIRAREQAKPSAAAEKAKADAARREAEAKAARERRKRGDSDTKAFGDRIRGQAGAEARPSTPKAPPSTSPNSSPPASPPSQPSSRQATPRPTPSHPTTRQGSSVDPIYLIASGFGVLLWWYLFTEGPHGFRFIWNPVAWIPVIGWFMYALTSSG